MAKLNARQAVVNIDGEVVTLNQGDEIPEGVPSDILAGWRARGAVLDTVPHQDAEPARSAPSSDLPEGAPDVADSDVVMLAGYIDSANLNAAQTVALAGGTAEGAAKVLEAERVASGGDGRTTVVKPLQKIAEGGTS